MLQNFHLDFHRRQPSRKHIVSNPKRLKYYFNKTKPQTDQQYLDHDHFYQQYSARNQIDRKSVPMPVQLSVINKRVVQPKIVQENNHNNYFRNAIMCNNQLNKTSQHSFIRNNTSNSSRKHYKRTIKQTNLFLGVLMTEQISNSKQKQQFISSHQKTIQKKNHNSATNSYKQINPFTKQRYLYLSKSNNKKDQSASISKNQQFMKITQFANKKQTIISNKTTMIDEHIKKRPQSFQKLINTKIDSRDKKSFRDYLMENKQDVTPWNMDFLDEFREEDQIL